jgi:putative phosphoserine phosphatase/1-acylglycerol-3-phosphate O-acyltransferase
LLPADPAASSPQPPFGVHKPASEEKERVSLHDDLTREIREGPSGPEVGALFDLDQTLVAGFSATAFMRERISTGRISPKEISDTLAGALSFALGRTGFSGMLAGVVATYRGLSEAAMREQAEECFEGVAKDIYPEARARRRPT